jgi:hypothetical protein
LWGKALGNLRVRISKRLLLCVDLELSRPVRSYPFSSPAEIEERSWRKYFYLSKVQKELASKTGGNGRIKKEKLSF